jgi:hypothetical protein
MNILLAGGMDNQPFRGEKGKTAIRAYGRSGMGLAILALFLLFAFSGKLCLAGSASECQVKTAFLFNFTKFAEWPASAFSSPESPIVILVIGQDPVADELETLRGKTAQGRKLVIKKSTGIPEGERFHVLFICKNEGFAGLVRLVKNRSVLTISDGKQFSRNGGIIGLVTVDNKVSFEINTDALDRAGLKVNSQVLRMAKIVKDSGQKEER